MSLIAQLAQEHEWASAIVEYIMAESQCCVPFQNDSKVRAAISSISDGVDSRRGEVVELTLVLPVKSRGRTRQTAIGSRNASPEIRLAIAMYI